MIRCAFALAIKVFLSRISTINTFASESDTMGALTETCVIEFSREALVLAVDAFTALESELEQ